MFAYDCVYARVCSMGVIVFYKRPRNHIQMSGPDYEESEINEITKLTIDARAGPGSRSARVPFGRWGRDGAEGLSVLLARSLNRFRIRQVSVAGCGTQHAPRRYFIHDHRSRSRHEITRSVRLVALTTHRPWTSPLVA